MYLIFNNLSQSHAYATHAHTHNRDKVNVFIQKTNIESISFYQSTGPRDKGIVIHLAPPPPLGSSEPSIVIAQSLSSAKTT